MKIVINKRPKHKRYIEERLIDYCGGQSNVTWTKVVEFDKEFELNLTSEQKLALHNLQFRNSI